MIEQSGVFNQVLAVDQQLVVLAERFVQGPPNRKFLLSQDGDEFLQLELLRLALQFLLVLLAFEVGLLALLLVIEVHILESLFLLPRVKVSQRLRNEVGVQVQLVRVVDLLFSGGGTVGWLVYIGPSLDIFRDVVLLTVFVKRDVLLLLLLKKLLDFSVMLLLVLVKDIYKQIDVLEIVDAETLADGVNFDFELILLACADAFLHGFVVDEIVCFINQQLEDVFDAFVLVLDVGLDAGHNRLILLQLAAAHSLILTVHDGSVLVHL